jgi:hypothetical protein
MLDALKYAWQMICHEYDAQADLPDMQTLLEGADLTTPDQAAETVIANMLLEVMGSIPRFSPWYKKPLGLRLIQGTTTCGSRWGLSAQTYRQWQSLIEPLSCLVEKNVGLILAANLLDAMAAAPASDDLRVIASCMCVPRRVILVKTSILASAEIICDTCQQRFRPMETPDADPWNSPLT